MSLLAEIPYPADSAALFAPFADHPWACFLDSARHFSGRGRYDIIAADPYRTLTTRGPRTEDRDAAGVRLSPQDPFALLRQALAPVAPTPCAAGLPFCGGAIGWLGYDLARRLERLPVVARDTEGVPDLAVGLYDWAVVVDHLDRRAWVVGSGRDPRTRLRWKALVEQLRQAAEGAVLRAPRTGLRLRGPLRSNMTAVDYRQAFARIQDYIAAGDCYQVNLAQRFAAQTSGDPWSSYLELRARSPAPFSAYLATPWARVLSSSPERFLRLRDGRVETRPIKGTRPRGQTRAEDAHLMEALRTSPKDRAENLMIVDLLRNDLGRVCRTGSVTVPSLFAVESYANVHHLVSSIAGELAAGEDACSLLRACFPGGSITGAPKIRAMEIIEELEPDRRGLYCGAIGYIGFDGAMDTNIAIRTLVHNAGSIRFWAGGGIVHDSDPAQEYQETFDKAAALLRLVDPRAEEGLAGCKECRGPT